MNRRDALKAAVAGVAGACGAKSSECTIPAGDTLVAFLIKSPRALSEEALRNLRESAKRLLSGEFANVPILVLEDGMDFQPATVTKEQYDNYQKGFMSRDEVRRADRS